MSIEINKSGDQIAASASRASQTTPTQTEAAKNTEQSQQTRANDTVSLTGTAKQLHKLESLLKDIPVVDTQRVEQTRTAVNNGSYVVHAGNVAKKLTQFEAYLPSANQ